MFTKIKSYFNGKSATLAVGTMAVVGTVVASTGICHADDFDVTSTKAMFDLSLATPKALLAYGIPIIITLGLAIWAIFWLVGKMKRHVK